MTARLDSRPRVWVVDDSPLDAQHAVRSLGAAFDTTVFADGSTVLEALSEDPVLLPVVIVLDWVMPAVSGLEVVRFIRAAGPRLDEVQVLLLTARQSPDQIVEGLDAGANDYLSKPYAPEELRARVHALLRSAALLARARAAEAALQELLARSPDAMLVVDAIGVLRFANVEALRSVVPANAVGQSLEAWSPELAVLLGAPLPAIEDLLLGGRHYALSARVQPESEANRTIVTLRDVTERRLQDQRRLDFYSIIAHDLRSPLQAMMMRTSLLRSGRRGPLSPEIVGELAKLDASHEAMLALINDFLDVSRNEAGPSFASQAPVDLVALAGEVVAALEPLAAGRGQRIEWAPGAPMVVQGEARGLSQVLNNLIGNALKFSADGAAVRLGMERVGHQIRTTVRDAGPGIAPAAQPTLFDRFTRVSLPHDRGGTGLGLMIVRQVVEAHGGRVGVESALGAGSTFWFELPAV